MHNRRKPYIIAGICLALSVLTVSGSAEARRLTPHTKKQNVLGYRVIGSDTMYVSDLGSVYIYARKPNEKRWNEYYRLVYNFNKVYPYALKAKELLAEADSTIESSDMNASQRARYLRKFEKELFREFEKPIRNLTYSQGRLLMRLIERECGISPYNIIKGYRGSPAAGFWQAIAKLFGADLKKPYDKYGEDRLTEELVIMYHDGRFARLYDSLF